ncbi:MAG: NUDIX domain-containing protein [Alphaproteobacteria bacterium]|nr:NUDIX domain-containing protein [Alphaproteobacteria bacterium]
MIAQLHRVALRLAHRLRHRWRRWRGTPLEGVTMIACDLQERVLLVRHSYGPEGWFLPGGGIRRGEVPLQAAVRELREETGCTAEGVQLLGAFEDEVSGSPHTAYIVTCLTADEPRPDRREVVEARFFPTHSLPEPLSPRTKARLAFWRERVNDPGAQGAVD